MRTWMRWAGVLLAGCVAMAPDPPQDGGMRIASLAFRVHRMAEMERFYSEAFGLTFADVRTRPITSRFAEQNGLTVKFVPIRDGVDFSGFPVHQPGLAVPDVERVMALAVAHGGRVEGEPEREDGVVVRAAVRDPDGNTIEIYRVDD